MDPSAWKEWAEYERRKVTVSLAVICDYAAADPTVILCSDTQLSGSLGSTQAGHKQYILAPGWYAAYAGSPDAARDMYVRLRKRFIPVRKDITDENIVLSLIQQAMNERKKMLCDEYTNSKFAMSHDEFLRNGKSQLPESRHLAAVHAMEAIPLGADFIIVGFINGFPLIIETNQQCRAYIRDAFAAIGDGGYLAHASLLHREHSEMQSFNRGIYHIYEAKKWAQRNRSVGTDTHVLIIHKNSASFGLSAVGKITLDQQYEAYGPKGLPETFSDLPTNSIVVIHDPAPD